MDYRRAFAAFLTLGLMGLAGAGASAPTAPPIREANWIAPGKRLAALMEAPEECVSLPRDREERELVALGRQLFENPLLLGGQAARTGLNCASCHRNGRGNPDFLFPALSGVAGTADVTSSLMSRTRGDGMSNPKPIPDLARDPPKIARKPGDPALASFIRGLIVDEFDGLEPSPRALEAVTVYVRAIQLSACKPGNTQTQSLPHAIGEITLGLSVSRREAARGDTALARLALGGVRDRLGLIAARYPGDVAIQKALAKSDKALGQLQARAAARPDRAGKGIAKWEARFAQLATDLVSREGRSLYNKDRLSAALTASRME